jgi:hypothetical protein
MRPYRPAVEFAHAIQRGDLAMAVAQAKDIQAHSGRPLPLELAVDLVALAAVNDLDCFDSWALRWLERWARENRNRADILDAVDIAHALSQLAIDSATALEKLHAH